MDEDAEQPEEQDPLDADNRPLDAEERKNVEADLEDLRVMRKVFERQGARGVVIDCPDCGQNHYYDWDLLQDSLAHMLETGEPRMHEPAFSPSEEDYVVWDYAKGYIDALADSGLDPDSKIEIAVCPWCTTALSPDFSFCPTCGRSLAVARLYLELVDSGLREHDVRAMLARAGFEPIT